jgi:hypothetical protein
MAPIILTSTTDVGQVSFTPWPFYSEKRVPGTKLLGGQLSPKAVLRASDKKFLDPQGNQATVHQFVQPAVWSLYDWDISAHTTTTTTTGGGSSSSNSSSINIHCYQFLKEDHTHTSQSDGMLHNGSELTLAGCK